jgi:copper(I)-binding protein
MQDHERQVLARHGQAGRRRSKPVYAAQMAIYQAYMEATVPGISRNPALFTAINKDSQEIWFELVPFDGGLAQRMSDRAVRVIRIRVR